MDSDPPFTFEHRFEHSSEGGSDVWIVIDASRGDTDPIATCYNPEDAMAVSSALNLAHTGASK